MHRGGPLAERGETDPRCVQGVRVLVETEDPKIRTGLEQGRRVSGAAKGGVHDGPGRHRSEELQHP